MNLERELREALRREEAPQGFAARILPQTESASPVLRRPLALGLAAGIAVAALSPWAVSVYRAHRDRERALEARAQLITALEITGQQLRRVREQVNPHTRDAQ